jgi:hypothetical protein
MGRFADVIRCHILEKYMSSYMRERNVDALLVLRNEDKWAMTGNFFFFYTILFLNVSFYFFLILRCDFIWYFFFSR